MVNYSKSSTTAISESPWKIRPGTLCTVEITYAYKLSFLWDTTVNFEEIIPGFLTETAVKCLTKDVEIPEDNINITENDDGTYTVKITAINEGNINLDIYYYLKTTKIVTAISAFNSINDDYYMDYMLKDDIVIPLTIIELGENISAISIAAINITPQSENNGLDYDGDVLFTINSQGLLESQDEYLNILRIGKEQTILPATFDGPYIKLDENGKKIVEFDNQEWQTGYDEARGLLIHNDNMLITTNKGICVFDMNDGEYIIPILTDSDIVGYDLTYYPDDSIGVIVDDKIHKYRLRHNHILVDNEEKRIYFREVNSFISVDVGL